MAVIPSPYQQFLGSKSLGLKIVESGTFSNHDFECLVHLLWFPCAQAYEAMALMLALRQALRPYTMSLYEEHAATGVPIMRPLFLEFPWDPAVMQVRLKGYSNEGLWIACLGSRSCSSMSQCKSLWHVTLQEPATCLSARALLPCCYVF